MRSDKVTTLKYWSDENLSSTAFSAIFPASNHQQFISFDVDVGGFNNIRMQFEYVLIMAAITGRTLVLPPPSPWYLINWGPIQREGDIGGVCDYAEFFDIPALRQYINVISSAEFIQQQKGKLDIPDEFLGLNTAVIENEKADDRRDLRARWTKWLSDNARVLPWNPLNNLLYHPNVNAVMESRNRPDERFIDRRNSVCFDAESDAASLLHFPSVVETGMRQLGQVTRLVAFADAEQARAVRYLLKHVLRYVPLVFEIAQTIIDKLGMFEYSSLHLRRNEIQFLESRADPETTAANISKLLVPGEPLYLATDEVDEAFYAELKEQRPLYRISDLKRLPGLDYDPMEITPHKLIGLVEQLVCAGGRVFAGTPHSSFSTYISRVHGYLNAADVEEYSHTQLAVEHSREAGFARLSTCGQEYLREDPLLWEDADLEQPIYAVSCTDTSDYIHWQCELLEYSWKQVGQTGELIRLVSRNDEHPLPHHKYTKVISTRFTNTHPESGDHYAPYNRIFSFQEWLDTGKQNGTVLILDPDCVFRKRVTTRVQPGAPIGQRWRGFGIPDKWEKTIKEISDVDIQSIQDVTWPALVHTDDLRRLMPRWIQLTSQIRLLMNAWESDMMAFVVAAAEQGLCFTQQHLAAVLNWPENEGEEAPVIHYCQAVDAKDGSRLWYKQGYQPWARTNSDPSQAKLPYCGDLLAILNEYVETQHVDHEVFDEIAAEPVRSPRILLKVFLKHHRTLEFDCRPGDEVMQALFQALAENTAIDAKAGDRLISLPVKVGNVQQMSHFPLSELIGLETIPVSA